MSRSGQQLSLFAEFNARGVEYLVVGGVAVNAHGHVRNTRDIDIFLRPSESNARGAYEALAELGAPLDGLEASDLLTDAGQYQFETSEGRIDLLNFIGTMSFDHAWHNRVDFEIDGVNVHFISKADLIENKRSVGRLIDLSDVEQLELLP